MDVKGVSEPYEEIEERPVVDRFSDLGVAPAGLPQSLDLLVGDAIGVSSQRFDEFQQQPVPGREPGGLEVPVAQGRRGLRVLFPLQLQEPRMAAQSIVAAVERRNVRGDHLVLGPAERAIREVEAAGLIDGAQEVGA